MAIRTVVTDPVPERSTYQYSGVIKDETGSAIAGAALTTMVLSLYALDASETVINALTCTDILNAGRGAVDSAGNLTVTFLSSDAQVLDPSQATERRVMLYHWSWAAGVKHGYHEVEFTIQNLHKVCAP